MKSERRIARLSEAIRNTQPDLSVVLENIHDPHNVSAILRTCDAVGVRTVDLLYNLERFPRIGKKSSASAHKWVEKRQFKSVRECFDRLREEGFRIAVSVVDDTSKSLFDLDLRQKIALVFGNEHRGVTDDVAAQADERFKIPMLGMVQSLNVSVACAITLYEALRQRLSDPNLPSSRLTEKELNERLQEWLKK